MNIMTKYIFGLLLLSLLNLTVSSCSSDGPDCNDAAELSQFVTSASNDYNDAFQAFLVDPSESNCNALGNSLDDFFDAIGSVSDCIPSADRESFEQLAEVAKQSVEALDCNI